MNELLQQWLADERSTRRFGRFVALVFGGPLFLLYAIIVLTLLGYAVSAWQSLVGLLFS